MAKVDYPIYKIRTNPHSKKVQGLKAGDVVRREYYDAPRTVYSQMVVLDTGTETIGNAEVPYFTGALIEGDEPRADELLDFVRITNLFDTQRSGALYLTASDSDAPYMDVIDSLARDFALLWPERDGGNEYEPDRSRYALQGAEYLTESYTESEEGVSRIYRLTRTAYEESGKYGVRICPEETVASSQRLLLSFKVRASAPLQAVPVSFGYTDDSRMDYADVIDAGTQWEYRLAVFTADYPATYARAFTVDLTRLLAEGAWFEIAELALVRLSDLAAFGKATRGRVGNIRGVADPVFGTLEGYGAYFRNLYAAGNVHIAGTLTAADEQGFASTFYVGRIHRNCVPDSLHPEFYYPKTVTWSSAGIPTGIGDYCRIPSGTALYEVQSEEWARDHQGQRYCFSFWARTSSPHTLTVGHAHQPQVSIDLTRQWQRFHYSFCVERVQGSKPTFSFTKGKGFYFAAPQLEPGSRPTPYQPTDGVLRETDEYGAWFARGGIGGTIQHPLLRLDDDGSVRAGDDSFVINPDGTGHFASGRFRWTADTIALQDFTIRWEDLSEEARENLKGEKGDPGEPGKDGEAILPDWVADWDSGKTVIDGSSIITPKIFAGVRNSDGTITGVALGRYELLSRNEAGEFQSETIDGLYGFHSGQQTFAIDTTGSVTFGRGEESIRYDASTGKISFGKTVSMQWIGATYIDKDGLFTGTLSADTVRTIVLDAGQITAGVIDAERLNVDELKARLLTAENIEALTLDVERGTIGGWTIDSEAIFRGAKNNTPGGYTAGPGAMTLSSNGLRGYRWRLESSGAGALAGGNILWDDSGKVTFSEAVSLQWTAPLEAITETLEKEVSPRLTHITSEGIYTGTLTVQQINAVGIDAGSIKTGTLSADRIAAGSINADKLDAASIRADIVNADYISGLELNFTRGRIGGWKLGTSTLTSGHIVLDSGNRRVAVYGANASATSGHRVQLYYNADNDFGLWVSDASGTRVAVLGSTNCIAGWNIEPSHIYKNNVSLGADGSIANTTKWKLGNDGSGRLASGNISWDAYGNVTFGSSVSLQWTSAANAALTSAKTYADTKKNEAVSAAAADATSKAEAAKELARAMAFGKMLYRDPTFRSSSNGVKIYNNSSNGLVSVSRISASAPNDSGYVLEIKTTGSVTPGFGGFYFGNAAGYRKIFITRMIARIPAGRYIEWASNSIGTGGSSKWLTPVAGTGDWCEYICKVVCGSGTFSSTNFFYLKGGTAATAAEPVVWQVAYATVFDVTASEGYVTTLDAKGIYTGTLTAQQVNAVAISAASIKTGTLSADRLAAGSIKADKLDAASIKTNIVNASYINGLELTFSKGKIGGWTIGADNMTAGKVGAVGAMPIQIRSAAAGSGYWYNGSYKPCGISMTWHQSNNAGHLILGQIAASGNSVKTGFLGLQMMSWDGLEYFCLSANYTKSGSKEIYNRIAGWAFDNTRIWKNNVSLGADGSITNGSKWKLNNDGSGSIASGNISWNAAGAVTFSSSVSLQWKNDIQAAKSANYGYRYYKRIVINGESAKYYPVIFKGGEQTVQRDIMIRRSYYEQAPSDWNNGSTTHMGGLNLLIKTNFGGWGGAGYSWDIYDLQESYCRMFGGAGHCGNYCMFAVFLRGGGTTGAVYHLYSDQPIESSSMSPSPIPPAPQIAYNSDLIFQSGTAKAYAAAPRTVTAAVKEEIRRHRFIALAQGSDTTLKEHPLTYIGSTGIYTGTIRANQIQVDSALVVGGSTYNGSISVRNASNAVKVTLDRTGITAVGGRIGGWNLTSSSLYAGSVYLSSAGNIYNGSYWRLNANGSGYLAKNNISWTAAGVLTMKGATIQDAVIKGTLRNPFVKVDDSIWIEVNPDGTTSSTTNKPDADKYDNICVMAGQDSGGWNIGQPELPWDVSQSGRRLCLTHYRYGSEYVYGTSTFTAPAGKYFYENGRLSSKLKMSRQVVELIGFGTSSIFYGWIVLNRRDLGTTSKYGEYIQYLAMGSVTLNSGYSITFKQKTYDGTKMSVTRTGTGRFTVYLPWGLGADKYMVMLSGKTSPVQYTPIYAGVVNQYSSSFIVQTGDDASANDGSFNFVVISTADFT